jgi:hypothetical protein
VCFTAYRVRDMCVSQHFQQYFSYRVMVFNTILSNISIISWRSVLLVEKAGVPRENHVQSQVIDKLNHVMLYQVRLTISGIHNSQL